MKGFKEAQPLCVYGLEGCEYLEWRPITFVRPPPKSYMCPCCGVVLGTSHGCQRRYSCDHVLCRPCVAKLEEDGISGCPLHPGSKVAEAFPSYDAAHREARATTLNAIAVFCINRRHGCTFMGRLCRLVHHVQHDCRFNEVSCRECGRVVPHTDVRLHLESGCSAGPRRLSASNANNVNGAASGKVGTELRPERAADVHERQDCQPECEADASNGVGSGRSSDWTLIGSPDETASRALVPSRSDDLECILVLKIPSSSWYDRPTTAPPTALLETETARSRQSSVTSVPDDQVLIDWPESPDRPPVPEWGVDGDEEASLRGFRFKVRHFRAELDDSCSGDRTTKFVIFELLVKKAPGNDVVESCGVESTVRWERVSLALKHPLGEEGFRLQAFNSVPAVRGPGVADQWSKVAVTTPVEWVTVREFILCDRADIVVRFC
ncbi:uncharacterized protein LOC144158772 [Haemaphysalis longicornis]